MSREGIGRFTGSGTRIVFRESGERIESSGRLDYRRFGRRRLGMDSGRSGRSRFRRTVFIRRRCHWRPARQFRRTRLDVLLLLVLVQTTCGGSRMSHRMDGIRRNEVAAARGRRRRRRRRRRRSRRQRHRPVSQWRSVWLRQLETGEDRLRGIRLTASGIGL